MNTQPKPVRVIHELVEESKRGLSLMESAVLPRVQLGPSDIQAADEYIKRHGDYTSYHLLLALRRHATDAYWNIPDVTRAEILCSALAHLTFLNDWGYLDPSESHDGEAAKALLEAGPPGIRCLVSLLDDRRPAPLFGTEEATMSSTYGYRRSDFAGRYLSLLMGMKPSFSSNPEGRKKTLEDLKTKVRKACIATFVPKSMPQNHENGR